MNFLELILKRESVRSYDPSRPLPRDVLERILKAGNFAPSAANQQPWEFLVVQSESMLSAVRNAYHGAWFKEAPQVLVVKGFHDKAWKRKSDNYASIETDLTIAMDHMILAATAEGVATCWIAAFDPAALSEALQLKPNERVYAITPLGYPKADYKSSGKKQRKPIEEVVKFL